MTVTEQRAVGHKGEGAAGIPVAYWFAGIGALFLAFEAYLYVRWVASGAATPNRVGASAAPGWMKAAIDIHIVIGVVTMIGFLWWYVVRPWRAEHRLTGDGLLMLACFTCFWGDLASNYFRYWTIYPTAWPNLGSWYAFIPGWQSPHGNLQAEATVFFLPMYAVCMFGFTGFACAMMRRVQARRPRVSKVELFLLAWLQMAVIDFVLELFWTRLGLFVYPSTIHALTVFPGHYYQFPVYESVLWGLGWAWLSSVRYFRNDRDEMFVQRGVTAKGGSPRKQLVIRFLAACAAANIGLLGYNAATAVVSRSGSAWPADFTKRPYMTGGLCGPGVTYACPAPK